MSACDALNKMCSWYASPLGKKLLQMEKEYYDAVLEKCFGYYLLQLGGCYDDDFFANKRIPNHVVVVPDCARSVTLPDKYFVVAEFDELPFLSNSIDIAVVSHVFEFVKNPHLVLEEIYHALVPAGKVIIFGFNPRSLWGMWRVFHDHVNVPWLGRFVSSSRMREWLNKLGFDVVVFRTFYFRPPLESEVSSHKLSFMERLGRRIFPRCGGAYMFVAEKKIANVTPIAESERMGLLKRKVPAAAVYSRSQTGFRG